MKLNPLILILFLSFLSCKKETNQSTKKTDLVFSKRQHSQDTVVPQKFLSEYDGKIYFKIIIKKDSTLKNDIIRALKNQTQVDYNEIKLDKKVIFCQFKLEEETLYNYCFSNDKMIFKSIVPINKAHFNLEYKDWNHDSKPELLTYYEQWEGGGGANSYYKSLSIYEIQKDTLYEIVSMPIQTITCELDEKSSIREFQYDFNNKTNVLKAKKTTGKGNRDANKIIKIDSVNQRTFVLKRYNNKIDFK
ncbi:hypothetical protein L0669_12740 [Flavobacterium bizetiae]|uniref:hypothetical protein n=1 Tax=Flavobacterium bizetiae TaxID=2704140 RepID=UPI0021E80FC3|nr:hypothetical protein [Flavobacterium bizetiae]UTN02183.1 hypothetical protein L0669_12740 [Flavobacterium bizetiae]